MRGRRIAAKRFAGLNDRICDLPINAPDGRFPDPFTAALVDIQPQAC